MAFEWSDIENARKRQEYRDKQRTKPQKCNVCKEKFDNWEQLSRHLSARPQHRCSPTDISLTLKCRHCSDLEIKASCHPASHIIYDEQHVGRECKGLYVASLQVGLREKEITVSDLTADELARHFEDGHFG